MDEHDGDRAGRLRVADPWTGTQAVGPWREPLPELAEETAAGDDRAAVYREVQAGEEFRAVRRRYRRFAFPAAVVFFLWYLVYVVAATAAPGLMGRAVVGEVNVAMVAGLAQFLTTFLVTFAYVRHARVRRDREALEVRWETQERTR